MQRQFASRCCANAYTLHSSERAGRETIGRWERCNLRRSWEIEMALALHDPVRHNAWATTQLLEFCGGLDEQTLNATVALYDSLLCRVMPLQSLQEATP